MLNDKGDAERNLNFYLIYEIKTPNSEFTSTAKDSTQREKIPYICGLRTRIECEPGGEHSTRSDRVTNIGYLLSLGASSCLRQLLFHWQIPIFLRYLMLQFPFHWFGFSQHFLHRKGKSYHRRTRQYKVLSLRLLRLIPVVL